MGGAGTLRLYTSIGSTLEKRVNPFRLSTVTIVSCKLCQKRGLVAEGARAILRKMYANDCCLMITISTFQLRPYGVLPSAAFLAKPCFLDKP